MGIRDVDKWRPITMALLPWQRYECVFTKIDKKPLLPWVTWLTVDLLFLHWISACSHKILAPLIKLMMIMIIILYFCHRYIVVDSHSFLPALLFMVDGETGNELKGFCDRSFKTPRIRKSLKYRSGHATPRRHVAPDFPSDRMGSLVVKQEHSTAQRPACTSASYGQGLSVKQGTA